MIEMIEIIYRNGYEFQVAYERPWLRFKGGAKRAVMPPPPPPAPTPTEVDEDVKQKDVARRRQRMRAAGRGGTILTEQNQQVGQATLLGNTA